MLQRSQILLEIGQANELVRLAQEEGVSMSELVRRYVNEGMQAARKTQVKKTRKLSPKQQILKTVYRIEKLKLSKAPSDLSKNLDHYLYGWSKKK